MPKDKVSKKASSSQKKSASSEDQELSMSSTSLTADVLNELLTSSSFIECIEKAVKKVIRQTVDEATKKLETSLDEKEASLKELIEKNASTLSDIQKTIDDKVNHLQTAVKKQQESIDTLTSNLNTLEQYTRRNNIRIFGVPERRDENTDQIVCQLADKLGVHMSREDIDRSHRVGQPPQQDHQYADALRSGKTKQKARPIIVKFTSYRTKHAFMKDKRKLKGSGTVVAEDLTKTNANLLSAAYTNKNTSAAWSIDGRVYVVVKDGNREKKKRIMSLSELEQG